MGEIVAVSGGICNASNRRDQS